MATKRKAPKKDAPKFRGQAKGPGWYTVWTQVGMDHTVVVADKSGKHRKTLSLPEAMRTFNEFVAKHTASKKR